MAANLNDEDLDILAEKILAKMLGRLARQQRAENDVPAPPPPLPPPGPAPPFKKRTLPRSNDVRPTPADYEYVARWKRRHGRKE